jgi:glycogen synthase kinase 3 beta
VKEVVQDPKYKNRELSIISQLDHPNIVEMKDYFMKMIEGECTLFILMEHMDTSLHNLLKECRRNKRTIGQRQRKIFAFQLVKALAYLEVHSPIFR